ncbi:MAG: FkbM family methyltransferase [Halieaceae bacterium]|jgi:FkbM family methyltransferase
MATVPDAATDFVIDLEPPDGPWLAHAPGLQLYTHDPQLDLVSRNLHRDRIWEPFETRLMLASLCPEAIVVDVGANLGYFSMLCARADPRPGRVFAFEPAADNFALLCRNIAHNGCEDRVVPVEAALAAAEGPGELHRSSDNLGDHQIYAGDGPRSREAIRFLNGSEFLSERVDRIDLLKIDTQGSEMAVLEGLLPLLRRSCRGLRILIELTPYSLRLAGSSGRQLVTLLDSLGLPLAIVDHLEHRLVASDCEALCQWCDNVDAGATDRGFMNIFLGSVPPGL